MATYLTFDIGTTALKTALIDGDGRMLAVHSAEYTARTPRPGWAEMKPDAYWEAAVAGAHSVLSRASVDPAELTAIGFSSQGESFIPLDAGGEPLCDAIVWVDNRAQDLAERWEAEWLSRDRYRRICGYPWVPGELTLFKIAWLAEHAPGAHAAAKFLWLPDYLIYRLTGEAATDYNIAQMGGLYDIRAAAWSPELLDAAGITPEQLPPVHPPGTAVGEVHAAAAKELGIPAGVIVCVGANDQLAGAIGAGNVRPGLVTETTGTALAVVATTEALLDDDRMFVGVHAVRGAHYGMPFGTTSAIVLTWFRDLCEPGAGYDEFLADVAEVPPGCEGLTVLPHFSGTACPTFNPSARGAIVGLTLGHTRAHIARAIMESCACLLRELLEPILAHDIEVTSIRSLGGAARSDLWLQMKADMLGIPVERPACPDAASLGAAMLAATGTGQFESTAEAADTWYSADRVFAPNPALSEAYQEVYARYLDVYERLYYVQRYVGLSSPTPLISSPTPNESG